MTDAHIHLQHESKLLSLPAEIRQAIYAHIIPRQAHASLRHGRILLSDCIQPSLGDDDHDGKEFQHIIDFSPDGSHPLQSSWGPHWECEGITNGTNPFYKVQYRTHSCNLFFVCKKM